MGCYASVMDSSLCSYAGDGTSRPLEGGFLVYLHTSSTTHHDGDTRQSLDNKQFQQLQTIRPSPNLCSPQSAGSQVLFEEN